MKYTFEDYFRSVKSCLKKLGYGEQPNEDSIREDWKNDVDIEVSAYAFAHEVDGREFETEESWPF